MSLSASSQVMDHRHLPSTSTRTTPHQQQTRRYPQHANAMTTSSAARMVQPSTPPRTPRRVANDKASRNATVESAAESASESQVRPKSNQRRNKVKNVTNTPGPRVDHGSQSARAPPNSHSRNNPATTAITAYAGPTFHASPAPSALPIPSFFSKAAPESPSLRASKVDSDQDSSSTSESPPLLAQKLASETRREESPLDIFFNADRKEKERARALLQQTASSSPQNKPNGSLSTPVQGRSRLFHSTGSSSRMLAMEVDGSPEKPYGPAFSTPYNERINAARSGNSPANSPAAPSSVSTDRSEALKSFLFSGNGTSSPTSLSFDAPAPYNNIPPQNQNWPPAGPSAGPPPLMNGYYSPQQGRHPNFGYGNEGNVGYANGFRNTLRASGLRQEVTPSKSPASGNERFDGNFPPFRNLKENSVGGPDGFGAGNSANPPSMSSQSTGDNGDIQGMENRLREVLKLGPKNDNSNAFAGAAYNGVSRS